MHKINMIYDKLFKKILTLSTKAVINMINSLFGTDYPLDSKITYNWTEFEDNDLKKTLADTIITINGKHSYHLEAQMTEDEEIIFRVFEYSFSHANRNRNSSTYELDFPEPIIIYLYSEKPIPDELTLKLNFRNQGHFDYKVKVFKYLETSVEELNRRKMVILIPFQLLRLRKEISKVRTPENIEKLKKLIQCDIIGSIEENFRLGNITYDDALKLCKLTTRLYYHIYSGYEELEVLDDMTDESIMFDIDYYDKKYEDLLMKYGVPVDTSIDLHEEVEKLLMRISSQVNDMNTQLENAKLQYENMNSQLAEKDCRIQELLKQIEYLKSNS